MPPTPSATAGHSIISLRDVFVELGGRAILNGVNLELSAGSFTYLVGHSGSGKSTLLRLLYADQRLSSGEVRIDQYSVQALSHLEIPYLRRRLGIVFQDYQLLPDRSVYQNIHFALQASGWKSRTRIRKRANEVLLQVGMTGRRQAMPHQLSGGEQQRVAIARALINTPAIIIADEPTGNLDPHAAQAIMDILLKINYGGTAILMATHEYSLIHDYPGQVVELVEGKPVVYPESQTFLEAYRQRLR